MVKSLLVHFPEIGRLKDEGENTPLNLFVCKSVMKGVSWGLLFLWLGVISCCLFACQQKEEEVRLTFEDGIAQALQTGKSCWCGMPGKMESIRRIISKRLKGI